MSTRSGVTVTFAGSGDAFGSGGRLQACIHLRGQDRSAPVLLDCGATSLCGLRRLGLDPGEISAVLVSHLHGDHFGGLPFLILDGQFSRRVRPLTVVGPPGISRRLPEAMECLFPGSSTVRRRFGVQVIELAPGTTAEVAGLGATAWAADHPSGAPALLLRLAIGGRVLAYTGDTAWTDAIIEAAAGADLLIAEAYFRNKPVPYHLSHADLAAHATGLGCRRVVLTHLSADMLAGLDQQAPRWAGDPQPGPASWQAASDGLVVRI